MKENGAKKRTKQRGAGVVVVVVERSKKERKWLEGNMNVPKGIVNCLDPVQF